MRPLIPLALLLGSVALGTSVQSATYLGTFPPSKQPPTATGPSAYEDGEAGTQPAASSSQKERGPQTQAVGTTQAQSAGQPAADRPPAQSTEKAPSQTADKPAQSGAAAQQGGDAQKSAAGFDVKSNFRNICSFCHADYGRKAGRGPQLMDSPQTDEFLFDRIKHGLTGRMPGFGGTYSDAQIHQFVKFIRSLKPGEEPKNPA